MSGNTGGAKGKFRATKEAFKNSRGQTNSSGQIDNDQEEAGSVQDTAKSSGRGKQGAKSARNTTKKGKKLFKELKAIKSLAPLVSILSTIGIVLLIIFLIIGFIGFFTTLPGLAMEKVLDNAKTFLGWLLGSENIKVSDEQITELAKYIEELGYNLEGCGFVPVGSVKRVNGEETGEIEKIECDIDKSNLYAYILANEKTYTVELEGKSILGVAQDLLPYATLLLPPPYNIIGGSIALARTVTQIYEDFDIQTKGMLIFDDLDADVNTQVEIDRTTNKLVVKEGFFRVDQVNYDLNGWTGRYGKPIELSLALHLSTLAPDFVRNFCLNDDLQTEVHISTEERNYDLKFYFETEDGTILDKDKINEAYESLKTAVSLEENYRGTNWRSAYKNHEDVSLFSEDGNVEFPYVPIQMLNDLNTISFIYSDYRDRDGTEQISEYIGVIGSDGKPFSFYDNNGNAKNIIFDIKGIVVNSEGKFSRTPICVQGELDNVNIYSEIENNARLYRYYFYRSNN